ncbi:TetR/AcrR family transcriptional regulator [Nocardia tengchongensis]|uniref:TetR/AcrR family transcriptional regulator n=1 Tax=Nocardia tengchongensis TaxID=2055889 RepID=UPI0036A351CF
MNRIVEATAELISRHGLSATTLDDVVAASGTSKGQVFHYFPGGKDELLLAVAQYEADRVHARMDERMPELSSWSAWSQWRDQLVGEYDMHGNDCPMTTLVVDLHRAGPGARALIAETSARLQSRIRTGIHQMQAEGLVGAHVDADAIAHSLVAGIHGATLLQLATGADSHIGTVIDTAIEQLESTAPRRTAVHPT